MHVEHEVEIARPPADVYAYLAVPANLPAWQESVVEVRGASAAAPAQAGEGWTEVRRAMGTELETRVEVAEAEPDSRFVVASSAGPIRFRVEHELTAAGAGTLLRVAARGEQRGALRLAGGLVSRQAPQAFERDFARLKEILEGASG